MITMNMPSTDEMRRAFADHDPAYEGVFFVAVRTTRIFCRPTCTARRPRPENVEFYPSARDALNAGYRPCLRCRPLEPRGETPGWLRGILREVEADPARRWTEADLRERGLDPGRVRRWFKTQHGMTFHAYLRARRLGLALGNIRLGADLTETAYDAGFESPSGFRDAFARHFGDAPGRSRGTTLVVTNRILTPLGPMLAAATGEGICLLEFTDRRMLETQIRRLRKLLDARFAPGGNEHLERLDAELRAYFAGELTRFTVPLVLRGTEFQRAVWRGLAAIPYGETVSYATLARRIGRPAAVRAVGRANGDNRLAVLLPCHRVVGRDGKLVGYGGGLWRKEALLAHERAHAGAGRSTARNAGSRDQE